MRDLIDKRNVLIHACGRLDLALVLDAIEQLSELERPPEAILKELPG